MTKPKQTSSAVSSIAAKYVRMKNADMWARAAHWTNGIKSQREAIAFFRDIRKLAASALAQDQVKGQGK